MFLAVFFICKVESVEVGYSTLYSDSTQVDSAGSKVPFSHL